MAQPPAHRPERLQLRVDGEDHLTDGPELDEQLRRGTWPREAEVCGAGLTGGAWRRVTEVPALAEALDAPDARFAARLRANAPVVLVPVLSLLLIILALAQRATGWLDEGEAGLSALYRVAAGQGPTLLAGHWWTTLTCHFIHAPEAPLPHVLGNLTTIGYCGYRVEKAWGWSGTLRVLLGGAALSAVLVSLFSDLPVVGSSTLAFALWGAQIAIGFRQGEAIPPEWRRYYGYGNLIIFVPLYVTGLGAPGVSDWGHLGGLLGGALAALSGSPAVLARAAAEAQARAAGVGQGAAALGIVVLIVILAGYTPGPLLAWGQRDRLLLPSGSAALRLPRGLVDPEAPLPTHSYLPLAVGAGADLLIDEWRFRDPAAALAHPPLGRLVSEGALSTAVALDPPPPLGPGWRVDAARVRADPAETEVETDVYDVIVVHHYRRGLRLLRLVERHREREELPKNGAARVLRGLLEGVELLERGDLREARAAHSRSPDDRTLQLRLAEALIDEGQWLKADELLAQLSDGSDGLAWEAARDRLALWERSPALGGPNLEAKETTDWIAPFLATPVHDHAIHRPAIAWLGARGECVEARAHLDWLQSQADRRRALLDDPDYTGATSDQGDFVDELRATLDPRCPPVDAPPAAP